MSQATEAPYTNLECLLLFQSILVYGTREEDFVHISSLLNTNALIKDDVRYDGRRLMVHSIKDLYTRVLSDEMKRDLQGVDDSNARKRKLQSQPVFSVDDLKDFGDQIPVVVERLYLRYRSEVIREIREEERRYAAVLKEIAEIERGEWDGRLAQVKLGNGVVANGGTSVAAKSTSIPPLPVAAHPSQIAPDVQRTVSPKPDRSKPTQSNIPPHVRTPSTGPHGPSPLQTHQSINNGQQPQLSWVQPYQPGQPNVSQFYQNLQPPSRGPTQSPLLPPAYAVPSSPVATGYVQQPIQTPQHRSSTTSPHPQYQQEPYRGNTSPMVPQGGLGYPPHFVAPRPSSATQYQQWPHGATPQYVQQYPQQRFQSPQVAGYSSPYDASKHRQPSTPKMRANATGFGTKWTPTPQGRTPGEYAQVKRPAMEEISPIMAAAELPKNEGVRAGKKRGRSSKVDEVMDDQQIKEEVNTPRGMDDEGSLKRKRAHSRPDPSQVKWIRNFQAISKSAVEQITHHKNGGMFGLPVKEKDAPGYKELIKRPQDFKSIKTAITNGGRAAAAVSVDSTSTTVWLTKSEDLIPPKGIINASQLERELMRTFANAIMFNPDPERSLCKRWREMRDGEGDSEGVLGYAIDEDSVVKDTRDIYADVEMVVVGLMRAVERRSESVEGGGEDDGRREREDSGDEAGDEVKRRRKV